MNRPRHRQPLIPIENQVNIPTDSGHLPQNRTILVTLHTPHKHEYCKNIAISNKHTFDDLLTLGFPKGPGTDHVFIVRGMVEDGAHIYITSDKIVDWVKKDFVELMVERKLVSVNYDELF